MVSVPVPVRLPGALAFPVAEGVTSKVSVRLGGAVYVCEGRGDAVQVAVWVSVDDAVSVKVGEGEGGCVSVGKLVLVGKAVAVGVEVRVGVKKR